MPPATVATAAAVQEMFGSSPRIEGAGAWEHPHVQCRRTTGVAFTHFWDSPGKVATSRYVAQKRNRAAGANAPGRGDVHIAEGTLYSALVSAALAVLVKVRRSSSAADGFVVGGGRGRLKCQPPTITWSLRGAIPDAAGDAGATQRSESAVMPDVSLRVENTSHGFELGSVSGTCTGPVHTTRERCVAHDM